MFVLDAKEEQEMKAFVKSCKGAHTKFLPATFDGNCYNVRLLQVAYKKLCKRGNGVTLTSIVKVDGIISMYYRTSHGKGNYRFLPLRYEGFAPTAKLLHEVEGVGK